MTDRQLGQLARGARDRLRAANVETPDLDARLLTEWALGVTALDLISAPERDVTDEAIGALEAALSRRCNGEPVHRIIGEREFYGLSFKLSAATLEPRPDTEALIDLILPAVQRLTRRHGTAELLDMGTGTGAIAIALLHHCAGLHAVAVDIAEGALATARLNAARNQVSTRFAAVKSDWFAQIDGRFHCIVSNPPYIPAKDIQSLSIEVRDHDPLRALVGGEDGLDFYRSLAAESAKHLYDDGMIAVEIGFGQYDDVKSIFEAQGHVLVGDGRDLSGHHRAMLFTLGNIRKFDEV